MRESRQALSAIVARAQVAASAERWLAGSRHPFPPAAIYNGTCERGPRYESAVTGLGGLRLPAHHSTTDENRSSLIKKPRAIFDDWGNRDKVIA